MSAEPSEQDNNEDDDREQRAENSEQSTSDGAESGLVRRQSFELDGTATLDMTVGAGRVDVLLGDTPGVQVEISHDPAADSPWAQGLSNLMNWVSEQVGNLGVGPWSGGETGTESGRDFGKGFGGWGSWGDWGHGFNGEEWARRGAEKMRRMEERHGLGATPDDAVRQCRLEQRGNRITLRGPEASLLKAVPLTVTVRAPAGSSINVRTGAGVVTVAGQAADVHVESGTGDVTLEGASGTVRAQTGSGTVRLGPTLGKIRVRTGSGDVEVASVGASSNMLTASGEVRLGVVQADVVARTGSGALRVAEAAQGWLELVTGSGDIRVGVRPGVAASVDLVSHSGQAYSDLPVSETPPSGEHGSLTIRGRTGSGAAVVSTAVPA